jgi:hypothetical protein
MQGTTIKINPCLCFQNFSRAALARSEVQGYQIFLLIFFTHVLFIGVLNEVLPFMNVRIYGAICFKNCPQGLTFLFFSLFCPFYSYRFYLSLVPTWQSERSHYILVFFAWNDMQSSTVSSAPQACIYLLSVGIS